MELTKKQILENRQQINEGLLSFENILMAAGFIPVIGEVADIALIIYYLYKGERLYAALMLIALVPTVGDILVKPFIGLLKSTKASRVALKGGAELTEFVSKNPQLAKNASKIVEVAKSPKVARAVEGVAKVNGSWGSKLTSSLSELTSSLSNVKVIGSIKNGVKTKAAGGTFKSGLKDYFQGQRITKYAAKKGINPESVVNSWWIKYGARQDRRNAFRKFIIANNLLAVFGIPSLTTFEEKIAKDADFREKVANNPEMSDYIAQNSGGVPMDVQPAKESGASMGDMAMGLGTLKMLARFV